MGTKPSEKLASTGNGISMQGNLVWEREVLDSFNNMLVDVAGKDFLNEHLYKSICTRLDSENESGETAGESGKRFET